MPASILTEVAGNLLCVAELLHLSCLARCGERVSCGCVAPSVRRFTVVWNYSCVSYTHAHLHTDSHLSQVAFCLYILLHHRIVDGSLTHLGVIFKWPRDALFAWTRVERSVPFLCLVSLLHLVDL